MSKYVVTVPVTLWLEVEASDHRLAHWEALQAERWMLDAVNLALADDEDNVTLDLVPENFRGYRILCDFDKAVGVRATLDLQSPLEERVASDGVEHEGMVTLPMREA